MLSMPDSGAATSTKEYGEELAIHAQSGLKAVLRGVPQLRLRGREKKDETVSRTNNDMYASSEGLTATRTTFR